MAWAFSVMVIPAVSFIPPYVGDAASIRAKQEVCFCFGMAFVVCLIVSNDSIMLDKFKALFSSRKPQYKCSCCGKTHEDWPAIAYDAPDSYYGLDDQQRRSSEISSDFCVIAYPDGQIDRFIRAVLALEVRGQCQNLDYGVWVSLSENNFEDYKANFNNEDHEAIYFGWLCSSIEGYESTFQCSYRCYLQPGRFKA